MSLNNVIQDIKKDVKIECKKYYEEHKNSKENYRLTPNTILDTVYPNFSLNLSDLLKKYTADFEKVREYVNYHLTTHDDFNNIVEKYEASKDPNTVLKELYYILFWIELINVNNLDDLKKILD